jgi:hypothetical protein
MNIKQETHLKMLIASLGVIDNNKPVWKDVAAFSTARDDFESAIDNVRAQELKQSTTTTGVTLDKRTAREAMCSAAAIVGGAVAAYADKQNNHELFASVDFSAADLLHRSEAECVTNCTAILNAGMTNLAALTTGKHLAQSDLDDLKAKIDAFNVALERPRQAEAGSKSATDQLPDAIAAADRIVERQLDRLMERFRVSNPDFYSAFKVARVIVDAGGGTSTPAPAPTAAPATTATK